MFFCCDFRWRCISNFTLGTRLSFGAIMITATALLAVSLHSYICHVILRSGRIPNRLIIFFDSTSKRSNKKLRTCSIKSGFSWISFCTACKPASNLVRVKLWYFEEVEIKIMYAHLNTSKFFRIHSRKSTSQIGTKKRYLETALGFEVNVEVSAYFNNLFLFSSS